MLTRIRLYVLTAAIVAFGIVAPLAGATATPSAPDVDVNAYATGVFDALTGNLTTLLTVGGLMAGVFIIIRLVRRFVSAH